MLARRLREYRRDGVEQLVGGERLGQHAVAVRRLCPPRGRVRRGNTGHRWSGRRGRAGVRPDPPGGDGASLSGGRQSHRTRSGRTARRAAPACSARRPRGRQPRDSSACGRGIGPLVVVDDEDQGHGRLPARETCGAGLPGAAATGAGPGPRGGAGGATAPVPTLRVTLRSRIRPGDPPARARKKAEVAPARPRRCHLCSSGIRLRRRSRRGPMPSG